MIRRVEFRNFKGLREVDLDLERFTVLVGPNASGKTSVLEGIYYLARSGFVPWNEILPLTVSFTDLRSQGSDSPLTVKAVLSPDPFGEQTEHIYLLSDGNRSDTNVSGSQIGRTEIVRLDSRKLSAPSLKDLGAATSLKSDGSGLATQLADLTLDNPDQLTELHEWFRELVPSVERVRIRRSGVKRYRDGGDWAIYPGEELRFDTKSAKDLPASIMSEGTLLVLGILTFFIKPDPSEILLIDDIDRGLHPRAQRDLINTLRRFIDKGPNTQIIATSHSPYLLDCLDPSEVRLTTLLDDGSTACARLDEHPEFETWKDEMAPGEMWSLFGEKWVAELRAKERVG